MYGSKADNLIKLRDAGINVPAFTIISARDDVELSEKLTFVSEGSASLYAVRSSCNLEDGAGSSFAGQFDTYLNVRPEEVPAKIKLCRESMYSDNVKKYMEYHHLSDEDLKMCVIVQEMADADKAGVLFTSNPQGILNESVISVARGLGEGVVSGSSETTTYYYNNTDKVYYYEGREDLLSESEIDRLIDTSVKIKEILGEYLDIEYAFAGDRLYILQARPITTISGASPLILDNSNIVESYPGLSLPLTVSFVHMVYSGVFKGVSRRVLKNEKELNRHTEVFGNMVGNANGRMYYKISNWYTVLKFLPFSKKIIPVWQEMLGVKNRGYDNSDVELSPFVRFMTYVNSFYELISVPRHMRSLEKKFTETNRYFYERYSPESSPPELIGLFGEIREKLLDIWDVTLLNDTYSFVFTALVKNRLKKKKADDAYINRYISGISNIESMKPIKALIELAYRYDEYSPEELKRKKEEYIRDYGDRNLEELKLESRTFRSHPYLLDERIAEYRKDPEKLKETYDGLGRNEKTRIKEDFLTRFLGKRCAAGIAGRERSRLNRSRVYGMVRLIFSSLGNTYAKSGLIGTPEDIFYLSIDEAFGLADSPRDMKPEIENRKAAYAVFEKLPAYTRLIFENSEFDKSISDITSYRKTKEADVLSGVPCSAGVAEGEALVIRNIDDARDVKDKILVTVMTDPGWVFLLASAKGVISEKGSLLSHTAIISRELKKPSIVGVPDLTDTIRTGDIIRMDGGSGRIEILRRKEK